jgi:hypothetical protein
VGVNPQELPDLAVFKDIGDILETVADTLQPRTFDEPIECGFDAVSS